jgi:hypothetical protein
MEKFTQKSQKLRNGQLADARNLPDRDDLSVGGKGGKQTFSHFKSGYSRVGVLWIPVAYGKTQLLELQVFAQYATVLDAHHDTAGIHTALYLLHLVW